MLSKSAYWHWYYFIHCIPISTILLVCVEFYALLFQLSQLWWKTVSLPQSSTALTPQLYLLSPHLIHNPWQPWICSPSLWCYFSNQREGKKLVYKPLRLVFTQPNSLEISPSCMTTPLSFSLLSNIPQFGCAIFV